ncbi:MBL fold metallo-hydrolase [Mucilaginibacter ginkgonis]|uniref:MBL fold metallo-hydrolase n=1 Tax=Mucilaginibacter ginkgonis TaxID=2682091 RepID=A0A6I4I0X6_9SPHI|nr:MBL fold metallo-hydrolase [Mucilaginibacter ginkgonis]QQL51143.1 MBL fold metallo-hydrolase [Mucilaginibacter ginkgonis]
MSLYIASINSGSNGNCYYVGNETDAILVDAGLSCREIEKRMARMGLDLKMVRAIFISHEHTDHVTAVPVLAKRYDLPVYITPRTTFTGRQFLQQHMIFPFVAYHPVSINGISVTAFPKIHDAAEPHSFTITYNGIKVGVITDIGSACDHVIANFKGCHAAFLEANYDEQMLMNGRYPYHLKRRISGGRGHISNAQALKLFTDHKSAHMSHLLLAHLSRDNNDPQLVEDLFRLHAGRTNIVVASRFHESAVYHITGKHIAEPVVPLWTESKQLQYALF